MAGTITEFFAKLGFPLRIQRGSWGAVGPNGAVLLRTWQDHFNAKTRRVQVYYPAPAEGKQRGSPQGRAERNRHLASLWAGGIAGYVVIVRAVDPKAEVRAIAGFRSDAVYRIDSLEIEEGGRILAVLGDLVYLDHLAQDTLQRKIPANTEPLPLMLAGKQSGTAPASVKSITKAGNGDQPALYLEKIPPLREWLISIARSRGQTVRYGTLMDELGLGRFNLIRAMSHLGRFCRANGEPVLTALIVNKQGRCSDGFKAEFGVDDIEERQRCYDYWDHVQRELEDDADSEAKVLGERARLFAEVEVRPDQQEFRRKVFLACKGQCVVSGCGVREVLDAAHIKGRDWREGHNEGGDGILLRADLHRLYDKGLLIISPEGRIEVDTGVRSEYEAYHDRQVGNRRFCMR